jgi:hypothetical protein
MKGSEIVMLYEGLEYIFSIVNTPSVPKYLSLYAFRETTLIKYILKNINIYGI